jgi:hypothetical protein
MDFLGAVIRPSKHFYQMFGFSLVIFSFHFLLFQIESLNQPCEQVCRMFGFSWSLNQPCEHSCQMFGFSWSWIQAKRTFLTQVWFLISREISSSFYFYFNLPAMSSLGRGGAQWPPTSCVKNLWPAPGSRGWALREKHSEIGSPPT